MNRREFIRLSCGAVAAAALPAVVNSRKQATLQAVAVGGSGTLYSSLPEAVKQEALFAGDEVKILILEDLHEAIMIPKFMKKKVTVDLGGHTLFTQEDNVVCVNAGTGDLSVFGGTFHHRGPLKTVPILA